MIAEYKEQILRYDLSTAYQISACPHIRDHYEVKITQNFLNHFKPTNLQARYVYVSQSSVGGAGEGLIARADIKQGQAVAFFNGVRRHQVHADFSTDHDSDYVIKLRSVRL